MTTTDAMSNPNSAISSEQRTPEAVIGQLVEELGGSLGLLLTTLGNRTGLWAALAGAGPLTAAQLAQRTQLNEALVREWCRAQSAGGYLCYSPAAQTFCLPKPVAAALVDGPGGALVDACADMLCSLGARFTEFSAAFRSGGGFGWHRHDAQFWHGSDGLTQVALPAELIGAVLDQLGPVCAALAEGSSVLDVGSGHGTPTIAMAQHAPAARVLGIDYHDASVAHARRAAAEAGVGDRVHFEVGFATDLPGSGYALITFFDSLHDLGDPVTALVQARQALAPCGAVLLVEPLAADRVEDNLTPTGRMFYAVSTLICTPNAIAQQPETPGLAPLGTQAGEALLRQVAAAAGFSRVRRVPIEAAMNLVLELQP